MPSKVTESSKTSTVVVETPVPSQLTEDELARTKQAELVTQQRAVSELSPTDRERLLVNRVSPEVVVADREAPKIFRRPRDLAHVDELIAATKAKIVGLENELKAALEATANQIVRDPEPEQKIRGEIRVQEPAFGSPRKVARANCERERWGSLQCCFERTWPFWGVPAKA